MGAETALKLVLLGVDRSASKALKGVQKSAKDAHTPMQKLGALGKGAGLLLASGLAVAGVAAVKFGGDSLAAFADADASQKKLEDAYKRFPKVQNVSIDAMRKYNQELQRKTGADADDIAAAQAQLAMFKLTGTQIKATTPLLVDYATKTGKSMPDAAKSMGKALLGNTKALKDMGISYKSTGDPAKDYANIMELLQDKVGGFAESVPEAQKKSKILAASFGDLQESVGEKLQPALMGLTDAGQGMLDWLDKNPAVMEGATAAAGLFGQALGGLWEIIRKFVLPAFALVITYGIRPFVQGLQKMLAALGTIPGFEWAKEASEQLFEVDKGLAAITIGIDALAKDKIDTGAEVAKREVGELDKSIKSLKGKQVIAKAKGDDKEVDRLAKKIKALKGKKLEINAHVYKTGIKGIRAIKIGSSGSMKISPYASGTTGTAFGGMALLGENGPELGYLGAGSRILSTGQTRAMQNRSGGGGGNIIYAPNYRGLRGGPRAFASEIDRELIALQKSRGPNAHMKVKGR